MYMYIIMLEVAKQQVCMSVSCTEITIHVLPVCSAHATTICTCTCMIIVYDIHVHLCIIVSMNSVCSLSLPSPHLQCSCRVFPPRHAVRHPSLPLPPLDYPPQCQSQVPSSARLPGTAHPGPHQGLGYLPCL